ncbi:hypothetical protein LCGC14_2297230, partial [marine sediment metagenome]
TATFSKGAHMRLLIFLLALSSAFFVSVSHSSVPDFYDPDPVPAETKYTSSFECVSNGHVVGTTSITGSLTESPHSACISVVIDHAKSQIELYNQFCSFHADIVNEDTRTISVEWKKKTWDSCSNPTVTSSKYPYGARAVGEPQETTYCPPEDYPDYTISVTDPSGQALCYRLKSHCPEPTPNDPFVFGTGGQTEKCFKNPDGTQCKIETDQDGGYYIPISYGSAEPVQCKRPPDKEVDKTSPPDDKPAPEETDDAPEMAELDALNKINDNLDAMNENQVAASDSNDERLDRVAEEIQIGNEILGEIRYNTDLTQSNTDDTNDLLSETNGLLADILDNTGGTPDNGGEEPCTGDDCQEPEKFTISVQRKNAEKGLNSIFTDEQRQVITDEIDEKKQEIEDYFEQIESESSALFDINPSLGGGYEERIEVIKGVEVDMGLGRLSSFFQLIAAAVMLCSTLTALYILLGP